MPLPLESVFDGELHNPGSYIRQNLAKIAAVQRRAGGVADKSGIRWIQEVHAILKIEGFGPNFNVLLLFNRKSPAEGEVDVEIIRAHQVIHAHVCESTVGWVSKGLTVEPASVAAIGTVGILEQLVRALASDPVQRGVD